LISLPLDLTAVTDPYLFFKRKQSQGYTDVDELSVWYRTSATDEWHSIAQYLFPTDGYEQVAVALPQPSATYQIAFQAKSNNAEGVYVDDVMVGDFSVGISDKQPVEVAVYPNPTTGNVKIVLSNEVANAYVQVCDIYGRLLAIEKVEGTQFELNLSGLVPGVYMLRFVEADVILNTIKVVKE
ncbi:MAG: T9SS type A sorting domain-containing protein, partial [Bacteroidales bacterium]|nr:T9SS type A sorting domain-containing protein [Bacteroidales bacterium]